MELGSRIRKLRLRQARTLGEIARECGFSTSLLSKIETGRTMPPVSTLVKIADALGVRVSTLLDEAGQRGTIHHKAAEERSRMLATSKGYRFVAFAQERPDKAFQPFLFEAEKRRIGAQPLSHRGEEFIYMLEGEMKYRVGSVEYALTPGDSLYFDSEDEHDLQPVSGRVRYLAVFSERPAADGGRNGEKGRRTALRQGVRLPRGRPDRRRHGGAHGGQGLP